MAVPDLSALCEAVAAASRLVAAEGLAPGTAGNVSGRLGDRVAVTPTGGPLSEMEAGDVTVVDVDGAVIGAGLVPSSELALHLAIYARFPGAGGVVHTHAPAATALACVLEDVLPCIHYGMLALGGDVPIAPYRTFGTDELAEVTVTALEGRSAALLAGHGTITYGADVPAAVSSTRLLEWAARLYLDASVVGTPRVMTAQERQDVVDLVAARGYGTLRAVEG